MARPMRHAMEIDNHTRGWTCIVQVLERHPVLLKELTIHPFQRRYRNFLLTDMMGTKVKAIMFDKDIDFFERSLKPFNRYKISNATVTPQREEFRTPRYQYTWYINKKTPVELIPDDRPFVIPCEFEVCRFSDLHKFAESDTNIAIKALVVHAFPTGGINETNSSKDYVVVNEEGISMVLRLWKDLLADYDPAINKFTDQPITIIASNLEVKTFHGLSLATWKNTYIIQDPPLAENADPKTWYAENKALVANWLKEESYENNNLFFPQPERNEILDLDGAMEAFKLSKTAWVRSKICISVTRYPIYEVICANCRMVVHAETDWNIECSGCMEMSLMKTRFNMPVTLNDGETSIRSKIKSPDAEKLTKLSATEFKKLEDEGMSPTSDLIIAVDYKEVICYLKYYDKMISGQKVRKYVILKTYLLDEMRLVTPAESSTRGTTSNLESASDADVNAGKQFLESYCNNETESGGQFFTPTTKNALEEIAQTCKAQGSPSTHTYTAKRTIVFGTINPEDLNMENPDVQLVEESPQKKNKGTEK